MTLRETWQGWLAVSAAILFWLMALGDVRAHELKSTEHDEMFLPTVRVYSHGGGNGSGVIVAIRDGLAEVEGGEKHGYGLYSKRRERVLYTYILTNAHVVQSNYSVHGRGMQVTDARFTLYGETETRGAKLVAIDEDADLALLRYTGELPKVAAIALEDALLKPFDEVWAVGSPAGTMIHITQGVISDVCVMFEHGKNDCYLLHSAPTFYGNSGGGLWRYNGERYELIGITSMIRVYRGLPVAHITAAIVLADIHAFLGGTLGKIPDAI